MFRGADPTKGHQSVCQHHWGLALQVTLPCQAISGLKTKLGCSNQEHEKVGCSLVFS